MMWHTVVITSEHFSFVCLALVSFIGRSVDILVMPDLSPQLSNPGGHECCFVMRSCSSIGM